MHVGSGAGVRIGEDILAALAGTNHQVTDEYRVTYTVADSVARIIAADFMMYTASLRDSVRRCDAVVDSRYIARSQPYIRRHGQRS